MRRPDQVEEFLLLGHNPSYLSAVKFDTDKIKFYTDINKVIKDSDTLIFATPSPFLKQHLMKVTTSMQDKFIISAIKGIVPDENMLVADYFAEYYNVPIDISLSSAVRAMPKRSLSNGCPISRWLALISRMQELSPPYLRTSI